MRLILALVFALFAADAAVAQSTSKYGIPAYAVQDAGPLRPPAVLVGKLPLCDGAHLGVIFVVTDANSPTFGATLTGGSTTKALAMCNGTNWTAR